MHFDPVLSYYDAKGTALKLRLLLVHAGVAHEWRPLKTPEEILKAQERSPFGELPLWETEDIVVSGSLAVFEHVAIDMGYLLPREMNIQRYALSRQFAHYCEGVLEDLWRMTEFLASPEAQDARSKGVGRSAIREAYIRMRLRPKLELVSREYFHLATTYGASCEDYLGFALYELLLHLQNEVHDVLDNQEVFRTFVDRFTKHPRVQVFLEANDLLF